MAYIMDRLFIDAETIIVNLLAEDKRDYVDFTRINSLCDFIRKQLVEGEYLNKYQSVVFDVNFDAIARTVRYRNTVFDLVGRRIYLKGRLEDIPNNPIDKELKEMIIKFVQNAA